MKGEKSYLEANAEGDKVVGPDGESRRLCVVGRAVVPHYRRPALAVAPQVYEWLVLWYNYLLSDHTCRNRKF